jgi:2-dehydro-3-deoxygluconokinase
MIDWHAAFADAAIFHWSGIDAALTPGLAEVCKEAITVAKEMGLTISYDINYRKNLWNYGKSAQEVLRPLMVSSDIMFGSEGEYALLTGIPAPGFKATKSGETYDVKAYEEFCKAISQQIPNCKYIYIALRNVMSSEHHTFAGVLYSNGSMKYTRVFDIDNVIDCVGVGDAFCGAMLYAQHAYEDEQKRVDFSTAASVLKNTIAGDYNIVKVSEVEGLLAKHESGEIAR